LFRYQEEFALKFEEIMKFAEPGYPVTAVERGKEVIVGISNTLL